LCYVSFGSISDMRHFCFGKADRRRLISRVMKVVVYPLRDLRIYDPNIGCKKELVLEILDASYCICEEDEYVIQIEA